ncbi:hypothetical protein BT69DRAFT_88794 [Atractiella rhizophila]|nr:hypothetical protein BT69DRAFT_88794 [Atractiella rhizophila]
MGNPHVYWSSDPYPMSFNPEGTQATDFYEVPPRIQPYQPATVPLSNLEAGPWRNTYSHSDRRAIPHVSLDRSGIRDFQGPMAAYVTSTSNDFGFPWTSNPSFAQFQNHQANHPPYAPLLEPVAEYRRGRSLIYPTSNAHGVPADFSNANAWFAQPVPMSPTFNYDHVVRNPSPFETISNYSGNVGMNAAPVPNAAGHENILAGSEVESTNVHRRNTANPQKTLEITRLERTFILYFEREAKRIWTKEELLQCGRDLEEECLEGPVTFGPSTSLAYVEVTLGGKVCLPFATNHRERNNFLRGQLKSIGDCAHKPSFKFNDKKPSIIVNHIANKERCPLHKKYPDLIQFAEWCRDL